MNFLCLDLEFNKPEGDYPNPKIVQLGYVIGNPVTGQILYRKKHYITINEPVFPFITSLCNITNEQVEQLGVPLIEAYKEMASKHKEYNCFCNPITFGGGDSEALRQRLGLSGDKPGWCFGRRWIDVKTVFISYCLATGMKTQSGLAKSLTKVGLRYFGTKHDAMDDAENTFILYNYLLNKMRGANLITVAELNHLGGTGFV